MSDGAERDERELALFIFVPFCKIKCTYCDFNAYANLARVMEPYARAVSQEISAWRDPAGGTVRRRAKSIYLGGGTPSLVPAAHIEGILRACEKSFDLSPHLELTIEANPGTVDLDKLRALRSLRVNRLSLGVQSFDDVTLKRLNRGHTVADALQTFELARRVGFDNMNLDLIYGLPLQTLEQWRDSLARALALAPEHLSLYALTVEEHTGLAYQIERGKYPLPDDDLAADMYAVAEEMLDKAGYAHYEISNWAKAGRDPSLPAMAEQPTASEAGKTGTPDPCPVFACRHNLTYWRNEPYLGFGAGAHSCFGGARYWDVLSPVEYIARIERGASAESGREVTDRELEMAETMILGLRLSEGIDLGRFFRRYGEDARERYARQFRQLFDLELLESRDGAVRLTARGRLLSNQVFWRLLPD